MRLSMNFFFAALSFALLLIGCDKTEVRQSSELDESRILAVKVTPHEIDLASPPESLQIDVIDYLLEGSTAPSYNWTLCASVGAVARYECLPDIPTLEGRSDSADWEIPFDLSGFAGTDGLTLSMDFSDWQEEQCPDHSVVSCEDTSGCPLGTFCVEAGCRSITELYPIELVVKVAPVYDERAGISAALDIPMRVGESPNQEVRVATISVNRTILEQLQPDCSTSVGVSKAAQNVELVVGVDEQSIDSFEVSGETGCEPASELSIGLVSWYATGGSLQKPLSNLDEPVNRLELEAGEDAIELYVVVRDGRGTIDMQCLTIVRD